MGLELLCLMDRASKMFLSCFWMCFFLSFVCHVVFKLSSDAHRAVAGPGWEMEDGG